MLYIAIFIVGIISGVIGIPLISSISEYIYLKYDLIRSTLNIEIMTNNVQISELNSKLEKVHTSVVGFQTYDQSEYEEEDRCKSDIKMKVGF
jgi:hypothetical protein